MKSIKKTLIALLVSCIMAPVLFIFLEGLFSIVLFMTSLSRPTAERQHTRYDPELGWSNIPDTFIQDMYGPNNSLTINSQGFRAQYDYTQQIPKGTIRIICSGDSFTFGYGVDDKHTWTQILSELNPNIETINMGQGGYGLDQAYLYYKRDSRNFIHQVHILAFISTDFSRMESDTFEGYGKPQLFVENGVLKTINVPVPKRAYYLPWLTSNRAQFDNLQFIRLYRKLIHTGQPKKRNMAKPDINLIKQTVGAIFSELASDHSYNKRFFCVLYLPTYMEIRQNHIQPWQQFVQQYTDQHAITFINLIDEMRKITLDKLDTYFLKEDPVRAGSFLPFGHYSNEGNACIAELLSQKLRGIPEFQALIKAYSEHMGPGVE
ncbi:hypothetical protein JXQ70_03125 [bacterium]|nr:hypothetical protein [bacterium]